MTDGEPSLDELSAKLDAFQAALGRARDDIDVLEEQLEEERAERRRLEDEVDRLDARTDMLELVENADQLDARQRAVTLIQHLHRAVQARKRRDEPAAATVDRDEAEEALHFPDVERTTIYRDMERAERLVGNTDVLAYTDGELTLDLGAGDLPAKYASNGSGENL